MRGGNPSVSAPSHDEPPGQPCVRYLRFPAGLVQPLPNGRGSDARSEPRCEGGELVAAGLPANYSRGQEIKPAEIHVGRAGIPHVGKVLFQVRAEAGVDVATVRERTWRLPAFGRITGAGAGTQAR